MKTTAINIVEADEIRQMNLPPELVSDLQVNFDPLFKKAQEWKQKADSIKVVDINDKDGMKAAREARLELKNIRVEADKIRVKLKEESLLKGKAIDGMFNLIKFLIVPIEKNLEEQEKFAELQEEKRLNEIAETRIIELAKYVEDVAIYNVRLMSEEAFNALLDSQKKLFEIKQEELKKAEELRLEQERIEKEEQEKVRKENERLKKEAEEKEKAREQENIILRRFSRVGFILKEDGTLFHTLSNQTFEQKEVVKFKESEIIIVLNKAESANAEQQRILERDRQEQEAKLKAEREAKEKAEKELADRKAAEEKAKKEEEEKAKKLQVAPDKDKLRKVAQDLLAIDFPDMQSEEGKKIVENVKELMKKVNVYIVKNIENL